MSIHLRELLDFAHMLAWQAGKVTMRYFQTKITTDRKSDDSPVTIADREAERVIRAAIAERYPDHAVLGEEEGDTGSSDAEWRWILDPIDGTRSFVRGSPLYGVMIGLEHKEPGAAERIPVIGVVHMPALGEIVYAAKGLGCWWNGRPCRVSQIDHMDNSLMLATRAGGKRYDEAGKQAAYERLVDAAEMFRTWGDCYGYVMVATGRAELMCDPSMEVWDAAALLPILEEAGGTFTDWQGNATIHAGEGLATNGLLLDEALRLIRNR